MEIINKDNLTESTLITDEQAMRFAELEVAIRHARLPPHLVTCLTHAINLFEGDGKAIAQFVVDIQREAVKRTQEDGFSKLLMEKLAKQVE